MNSVHTPAQIIEGLIRRDIEAQLARDEAIACALILDSLPKYLRWAVDHPRVLRCLKRARLWKPPMQRVVFLYGDEPL